MSHNHCVPGGRRGRVAAVVGVVSAGLLLTGCGTEAAVGQGTAAVAAADEQSSATFSDPTTIDNRYLPLTRKKTCVTKGRTEDGVEKSVRTVLKRTKTFTINGQQVPAAVIRDNAYEDGELVETTLDYFAQADDGTVYYLGEQVKNLESGRVVNTKGTWLFGKDTNRMGVAMPPAPKLGQQWHFEDVPGVTTESNTVRELGVRMKVRGWGVRTDTVRVEEFIQPEGELEHKVYAAGIGLIADYDPEAAIFFHHCS